MLCAVSGNQDIDKPQSGAFDVAIVGGGVAGNYTAWRLIKDQPKLKIIIIEQSARLGGRLYSEQISGINSVQVEHGGMRFSRNHKLLSHLVDYLGLPTRPFKSVLANKNPISDLCEVRECFPTVLSESLICYVRFWIPQINYAAVFCNAGACKVGNGPVNDHN
jgi:monoamine oxidase